MTTGDVRSRSRGNPGQGGPELHHCPPSPFAAPAPHTVTVVKLTFIGSDGTGIDPAAHLTYEEDCPVHVFEPTDE